MTFNRLIFLLRSRANLYSILTYSGSVPFIAAAVCVSIDIDALPIIGSVHKFIASYGLAIVSFMAGVHWGQSVILSQTRHSNDSRPFSKRLPLFSNLVTLAVWFSFLIASENVHIVVLIVAFLFLLAIDSVLLKKQVISGPYFRLSAIVAAALLVVLFSLV